MRASKKVLGVIVALAMLVNIFAMFSFAAAPDTVIDLSLKTDKESYSAGEIVTFTVHEKVEEEVGDMTIGGNYAIGYNSAIFGFINETAEYNPAVNLGLTAIQKGYDDSSSALSRNPMISEVTEGMGWDKVCMWGVAEDPSVTESFDARAGVDVFSFQMKIADNAPDGDYIIGFNKPSYDGYDAYCNTLSAGGIYGNVGSENYYSTAEVYGCGTVTVHIGAPVAEGPVVEKAGAHVKFTLDETGEGVLDEFKLRIKSRISDTDWDTYFGSTTDDAAKANKITAVGMVAFPVDGEFDKALAMTAIENINNAEYKGEYKAASTTYIQKVDADSDAYFGAIINLSHEETKTANLKYIGYVQYLDSAEQPQTIFYATDYEANISDPNYGSLVSQVLPSQAQ